MSSDCMNRANFMAAAIKPLRPGTTLVGQARTVTSTVAAGKTMAELLGLGEAEVIGA